MCIYPKCPFAPVPICIHFGEIDIGHLGYPFSPNVHLPWCLFAPVPNSPKYAFSLNTHFPRYAFAPNIHFPKCQFAPSPLYLTPPPFARDPFVLVPNCPGPICPRIVQPAFICIAFIDPKAKSAWLSPGGAIKVAPTLPRTEISSSFQTRYCRDCVNSIFVSEKTDIVRLIISFLSPFR